MSELLPFEELYPHLFQPMTIKKTTFKNRIFAAPQGMNNLVTTESFLNPEACVYYGNKARGGAAAAPPRRSPDRRKPAATDAASRY